MALKVVKATEPTGMYMTVTVHGDERGELEGQPAQLLARQYAQSQGFSARGLADQPRIYPVNQAGEASERVAVGLEKLAGWESEYRFCTGI